MDEAIVCRCQLDPTDKHTMASSMSQLLIQRLRFEGIRSWIKKNKKCLVKMRVTNIANCNVHQC